MREKTEKQKMGGLRLVVLGLLLAAAAGLLLWPTGPEKKVNPEPAVAPTGTPIPTQRPAAQTARQTREAAYEKDLATLQALTKDESLQEETRQEAARQVACMTQQHQMELSLEEMLTHAGFAPCMVLMQNDALTVAVSASEVTAADSAVILSICLTHTDIAAENIRIMPGGL